MSLDLNVNQNLLGNASPTPTFKDTSVRVSFKGEAVLDLSDIESKSKTSPVYEPIGVYAACPLNVNVR